MLRVGVIGMGPIGNLHADLYRADPLAELVGVCDRLPERAQAAGERLGVPWFLEVGEMLARVRPCKPWRPAATSCARSPSATS